MSLKREKQLKKSSWGERFLNSLLEGKGDDEAKTRFQDRGSKTKLEKAWGRGGAGAVRGQYFGRGTQRNS